MTKQREDLNLRWSASIVTFGPIFSGRVTVLVVMSLSASVCQLRWRIILNFHAGAVYILTLTQSLTSLGDHWELQTVSIFYSCSARCLPWWVVGCEDSEVRAGLSSWLSYTAWPARLGLQLCGGPGEPAAAAALVTTDTIPILCVHTVHTTSHSLISHTRHTFPCHGKIMENFNSFRPRRWR